MTLPTRNIYPLPPRDTEEYLSYLQTLVFGLVTRDEDIADAVNGSTRSSYLTDSDNWTPTLAGTTTAGTFTYSSAIGWVHQQGLLVDCWFDITWTGQSGATGNLYVILPYVVSNSGGIPFVGCLQTSTIAYGAGYTVLNVNAIPETFRGEIWASGTGVSTTNIAVASSGRLIGNIRYMTVVTES